MGFMGSWLWISMSVFKMLLPQHHGYAKCFLFIFRKELYTWHLGSSDQTTEELKDCTNPYIQPTYADAFVFFSSASF